MRNGAATMDSTRPERRTWCSLQPPMKKMVKESTKMKNALLKFGCNATTAAMATHTASNGRNPRLRSPIRYLASDIFADKNMTRASLANSTGCILNLYIRSQRLAPLTRMPQTKRAMRSTNEARSIHGANVWYFLKSIFMKKTSMQHPSAILIACCCMKKKADLKRSYPMIWLAEVTMTSPSATSMIVA
jgi:hypothetical protein